MWIEGQLGLCASTLSKQQDENQSPDSLSLWVLAWAGAVPQGRVPVSWPPQQLSAFLSFAAYTDRGSWSGLLPAWPEDGHLSSGDKANDVLPSRVVCSA